VKILQKVKCPMSPTNHQCLIKTKLIPIKIQMNHKN